MSTDDEKEQYAEWKKIEKQKVANEQEKLLSKELPRVKLPAGMRSTASRTIGEFASELGEIIAKKQEIFFKPELKCAVEIRKFQTEEKDEYIGFSELSGARLVTLAEKMAFLLTWAEVISTDAQGHDSSKWIEVQKNMTLNTANLTVISEQFIQKLPLIKRIFTIPIPILYQGKITFPRERYDPRFLSWLDPAGVQITELPVEEAKKIINEIFAEFCFEKDDQTGNLTQAGEQSKVHAIAGLITPYLRGLYSKFNTRTPLFFYLGNRPRVGKDYCAGVTGLVYEGVAIEEPPISTGDRHSSGNEELRKKIMSVMLRGRRRLHFSNNKGKLNSAVLENIITASTFSDRVLGKNDIATFENEMEFSLSGNLGISFSPDLTNRTRFINLFLDIEDPNSRSFTRPDLHKWVIDNRAKILSSIYTLVKTWYDAGAPRGKTPFASFPEWAEVCGGVMTFHGLGNPCLSETSELADDCDEETTNMKKLFELLYIKLGGNSFTKKTVCELLENDWQEEYSIFKWVKFDETGGRVHFSKLFKQNVGRIYSGLKLRQLTKAKKVEQDRYIIKNISYDNSDDEKVVKKEEENAQKTLTGDQ